MQTQKKVMIISDKVLIRHSHNATRILTLTVHIDKIPLTDIYVLVII